jgi:GntR family transcriptional repressor for pyruvate dehydrogenase complex
MKESNVTNKIIAYIADNIKSGTWKVGDKLPSEHELCKHMGVSRISVRSALQQFAALGILKSEQGKGSFLMNDDISAFAPIAHTTQLNSAEPDTTDTILDMKNLLEFRLLIEPEICAKVAVSPTPSLLEHLEALLDLMKRAIKDTNSFVNADMEFHMALCEALHNPVLTSIMSEVERSRLTSYMQLNKTVGSYGGIYYHSLILDALRSKNAKRAYNAMKEHLEHSIGDLSLEH